MLAKSPGSGKAVAGGRKFGLGQGNHVSWLNWLFGLASHTEQSACSPAVPEGSGHSKREALQSRAGVHLTELASCSVQKKPER